MKWEIKEIAIVALIALVVVYLYHNGTLNGIVGKEPKKLG